MRISEVNHPCSEDYKLSIPNNPNFSYQWYLDGVAIQGEVSSELSQVYGEGSYQVRIIDGSVCRISAGFDYLIPEFQFLETERICEGDVFEFGDASLSLQGVYVDTFKNQDNCDSIVTLVLEVIGRQYDTVSASILAGESYLVGNKRFTEEGEYPVTLSSSIGCDSLVLIRLSTFNVFIPTAFSPNGDAVNDVFKVFSPDDKIESVEMRIFDRWGNMLSFGTVWDGGDLDPGVYVYLIDINFIDGSFKSFSGDVALIE